MTVKNTFRIIVGDSRKEDFDLKFLVTSILFTRCQVERSEIFCLQDFPHTGVFDVTFHEFGKCLSCFQRLRNNLNDPTLKDIKIEPLFNVPEKIITVHVFNPFMDMDLVVAFLSCYCKSVKVGKKLVNEFGIYNGKTVFEVQLNTDEKGYDGLCHPPSNFNIAGNRGFMSYAGQPKFCKRCCKYGHVQKECEQESVCRHCKKVGHEAKKCPFPKSCDICGAKDHMVKQCPCYKKEQTAGKNMPEESNNGKKESEKEDREMKVPGGRQDSGEGMSETEMSGKKVDEKVSMDFQASNSEEEKTVKKKVVQQGRKRKVVGETFFHRMCNFAKLREMGFVKLRNTDCLLVPENFVAPTEWLGFEESCFFT